MVGRKKTGARTVSLSSQPFNFPQAHSNSTSDAGSSDMLVFEQLLDQSGNRAHCSARATFLRRR